jgi:hypothetical protein
LHNKKTKNVVCSSFEPEHSGDAKARSYLCPITKFDLIFCLLVVQSILQALVPLLQQFKQKKEPQFQEKTFFYFKLQGFQRGPVPGSFPRLRSCTVPAEITEPPPPKKISGGQNHKYDG